MLYFVVVLTEFYGIKGLRINTTGQQHSNVLCIYNLSNILFSLWHTYRAIHTYIHTYVCMYVCMYVHMYLFQSFHLQNKYTIQLSLLISSFPFHCTSVTPRTDTAFFYSFIFKSSSLPSWLVILIFSALIS